MAPPIPRIDWSAVEDYVRARLNAQHDVYGWGRMEGESEPSALVLAAESASIDSFPKAVGGIRIVLKRVPPPER
jgi:hypothetical protein